MENFLAGKKTKTLFFSFLLLVCLSLSVSAAHTSSASVDPTFINCLWTPANVNFTISNDATSTDNITEFNITAPPGPPGPPDIEFIGIVAQATGLTCSYNASLVNCTGANVGPGSSTWVQPIVNASTVGPKTFTVDTVDNASAINTTTVNLDVYGCACSGNVYPQSGYFRLSVDSGCSVYDCNTTTPLQNYFVNATLNETQMWTNYTNALGDVSGVLNTTSVSDCNYTFYCRIYDNLTVYYKALTSGSSVVMGIAVDNTPPSVDLTISPANGSFTTSTTVTYTPSCSDNKNLSSCITYVRDCLDILTPCTIEEWQQLSTTQGAQNYALTTLHRRYEFYTNASDAAGNTNETPIYYVMYGTNVSGVPVIASVQFSTEPSPPPYYIRFCVSESLSAYPVVVVEQEDGNITNAVFFFVDNNLCYIYNASVPSNSLIKKMQINGTDFDSELGVLDYRLFNNSVLNQLLTFPYTQITINFTSLPAGAFDLEVQQFNATPSSPPPNSLPLHFSINSNLTDGTFNARVCFSYTDAQLAAAGIANEEMLQVSYWNGSRWVIITPVQIIPDSNLACVTLDHFTDFSLNSQIYVNGTDITRDWTSYVVNNLYYDGILQLNFTSGLSFDDNITRIDVTWNGTASNTPLTVQLYNDTNGDGVFDKTSDTSVGSAGFAGGVAYFNSTNINYGGLNYIPVPANGTRTLFVVYNFTSPQTSGTTMDAWIDTAGIEMSASGNTTDPINPDGYVSIDLTNPAVSLSTTLSNSTTQCGLNFTNTNIVTYTPNCADAHSGIATCKTYVRYCAITNPATACTGNWTQISDNQTINQIYNMTADGRYEFKTNASDNVNNTAETTIIVIIRDTALPTKTNIYPGNNSVINYNNVLICETIHPTGSYLRDGIIIVDGQTYSFDYTGDCSYDTRDVCDTFTLSEGWHNVTMIVNDSVNTMTNQWRFKINTSLREQYIELYENWNLISVALVPESNSISSVLAGIIDDVGIVWAYDPSSGWSSYVPGGASSLSTLREGKGYWIKMKNQKTLYVYGTYGYPQGGGAPDLIPVFSVSAGWNLVSVHIINDYPSVNDVFAGLGVCPPLTTGCLLRSVIGFNSANQEYFYVSLTNWMPVTRGLGYWIYVNASGTYPAAG